MTKSTRESIKSILKLLENALNKPSNPTTSSSQPINNSKDLLKHLLNGTKFGEEFKNMEKEFKQLRSAFKEQFEQERQAFDAMTKEFNETFKGWPKAWEEFEKQFNPDNINGVDKTYQFKKSVIAHGDSRQTKMTLTNKNIKTVVEFNAVKKDKGYTLQSIDVSKFLFIGDTWQLAHNKTYDLKELKHQVWDEVIKAIPSEFKEQWARVFKTAKTEYDNTNQDTPLTTATSTEQTSSGSNMETRTINVADYATWPKNIDLIKGLSVDSVFTLLSESIQLSDTAKKALYFTIWATQLKEGHLHTTSLLATLKKFAESQDPLGYLLEQLIYLNTIAEVAPYSKHFTTQIISSVDSFSSSDIDMQNVYLHLKMIHDTEWALALQHQRLNGNNSPAYTSTITEYLKKGIKFEVDSSQKASVLGKYVQSALNLQYAELMPKDKKPAIELPSEPVDNSSTSSPLPSATEEASDLSYTTPASATTGANNSSSKSKTYVTSIIAAHEASLDRKIQILDVKEIQNANLSAYKTKIGHQHATKLKITGVDDQGEHIQFVIYAPTVMTASYNEVNDTQIRNVVALGTVVEAISHTETYGILSCEGYIKSPNELTIDTEEGSLYYIIDDYLNDKEGTTLYIVKAKAV